MKKAILKVLALGMCLCMVAGLFAACAKDEEEAIVIGMSGPLTGGAAVYGVAVQQSAQMAVNEINEAGGLNGTPFKLIALDDMHDKTKVETNYAELMEKGMQVSLGCVTTDPGLEFAALSAEDNVFFLTPSASGNAIVGKGDNGYQMCFADDNQGIAAANYVLSLELTKVGVFFMSGDPYSQGIYDNFKNTIGASGAEIEIVETSFVEGDSNFATQIDTLAGANCEFIFMPIYYTPASNFMMQAKGKIVDSATYYGCDGFDGIESAEGFVIGDIPQEISMLSHFNSKATEGAAAEFIEKYTNDYGKDTLNQFGASAYDCVYAIYGALKAAVEAGETVDANTSASDMCEILKKQFNGGYTYSGNTGSNIKWTAEGYVDKQAIAYVLKEAD